MISKQFYTMGFFLFLSVIIVSCFDVDPNINKKGENIIETNLEYTDQSIQIFVDTIYVPIYSDIYSQHRQKSSLLTATLSIRSTSLRDTTYINDIIYYDTKGDIVRSYIDRTLVLAPMQSIDYVIEQDDTVGGSGANFLVTWGARKDTKPLLQAVMISKSGQHGLSFITNGISIKE